MNDSDWIHYEAMRRLLVEWSPCPLVLCTELGAKMNEVAKELNA